MRPPIHRSAARPPGTIANATSLSCVVIADGANEMVPAVPGLAVAGTQHGPCLNPASAWSAILSGLAWQHADTEGLSDGKQGDGRGSQWKHLDGPGSHTLTMASMFVSSSARCSGVSTPILGDGAEDLQAAIHPPRRPATTASLPWAPPTVLSHVLPLQR